MRGVGEGVGGVMEGVRGRGGGWPGGLRAALPRRFGCGRKQKRGWAQTLRRPGTVIGLLALAQSGTRPRRADLGMAGNKRETERVRGESAGADLFAARSLPKLSFIR